MDSYTKAVSTFVGLTPPPWEEHKGCSLGVLPNLVPATRREGFFKRKVKGGECTGCGWFVSDWRYPAIVKWVADKKKKEPLG